MPLPRLVELDRLRRETLKLKKQESVNCGNKDLDRTVKLPSESKGGVMEIYTKVLYYSLEHAVIQLTYKMLNLIFRFVMIVEKNSVMEKLATSSSMMIIRFVAIHYIGILIVIFRGWR